MAWMSMLYPKKPINLEQFMKPLPADGSVPGWPEWRWLHTAGHSPGHVSFFRERDRALITTRQESASAVMKQTPELNGPPAYFTPDRESAHDSVKRLAALNPEVVATGHGTPLRGERMRQELHELANKFNAIARPTYGRYLKRPARAGINGILSVPQQRSGKRRSSARRRCCWRELLLPHWSRANANVSLAAAVSADKLERPLPETALSSWLTRFVMLRLLGLLYAVAFLIAANQILPLIGSHGLLPVGYFSIASAPHSAEQGQGLGSFCRSWFNYSDVALVAWQGSAWRSRVWWLLATRTQSCSRCSGRFTCRSSTSGRNGTVTVGSSSSWKPDSSRSSSARCWIHARSPNDHRTISATARLADVVRRDGIA